MRYRHHLAKYPSELDNLYVAFLGNTGMVARNDYMRLDGPSMWPEYFCQNNIVHSPTYLHSVWRDKSKDYGGN